MSNVFYRKRGLYYGGGGRGGVKEISLKMRGDIQADLYGEE